MERDVERDLRGSQTQCSHVLRTHPPPPSFCDYQGSLPASQSPEVLLGFYYIGTIDQIIGHWWLTQFSGHSPSQETGGGAEMSNPLITGSFWWPAPSQGYLRVHVTPLAQTQVDQRGSLEIAKDKPITREILRVLGALAQNQGQGPSVFLIMPHFLSSFCLVLIFALMLIYKIWKCYTSF